MRERRHPVTLECRQTVRVSARFLILDIIEVSSEADRVWAPDGAHCSSKFLKSSSTPPYRDVGSLKLVSKVTLADAGNRSTATQSVQCCETPGEDHGILKESAHHARAELNLPRPRLDKD